MKKSSKSTKVVTLSNKILDILEVIINPIHSKAVEEQTISKNEITEVFTVAKLIKDIGAFAETSEGEFENLTDEEIKAKLEEYRREQENETEEGSDE
jgi:hypothetical protein